MSELTKCPACGAVAVKVWATKQGHEWSGIVSYRFKAKCGHCGIEGGNEHNSSAALNSLDIEQARRAEQGERDYETARDSAYKAATGRQWPL